MPLFHALYFLGSDAKPFHIEEIDAESREGAIREAWLPKATIHAGGRCLRCEECKEEDAICA